MQARQQLEQLRRRFPGMAARDLRMAVAREHGVTLTMKEIQTFLDSISGTQLNKAKETLAPKQVYKGAVAAEGPNERWQADLAIMKGTRQRIGFLLVVDVYSRMAYARAVPNKQSVTLLDAFRDIFEEEIAMDGGGGDKLILTTDAATEFAGEFRRWCERQGIIWRQRQPGAKNDIAVCDAAMRGIKHNIATMLKGDRRSARYWPQFLDDAVRQNNMRARGAHWRPQDVQGDNADMQNFLLQQDNARRFDQNDKVEAARETHLVHVRRFRPPDLPTEHNFGERTGVTTYGHTRNIDRLAPGRVFDRHGNEHALKLVQIIGPRP